jgi:Uroporphyrinogen decarboxylase (URO-D)
MATNISPQQILKDLLQGYVPARPLFAPIVFALASRLENLPLPSFLANPTKISNALRQIREPLRTDALTCYGDPYLEVEALGAKLEWPSGQEAPVLRWPAGSDHGKLPERIVAADESAKRGRVPVALEVVGRLKALLRDELLLLVCLSGPLTLAARLMGLFGEPSVGRQDLPDSAIEIAAATITQIAKVFAEAGANLIFLREEFMPLLDSQASEEWVARLTPIFNIIRFYEALPILQIVEQGGFAKNSDAILRAVQNSVVCIPLQEVQQTPAQDALSASAAKIGVSLPISVFQLDRSNDSVSDADLRHTIQRVRPMILTSAGDLPRTTDARHVAAISQLVR